MQKRVCVANSSLSSVQGGTLLNSGTDAAGSKQQTSLQANWQPKNEQGCSFLGEGGGGSTQQRVCGCFLYAPSIAERTRMSVVISSSEICVVHKSRR